jgi:hypothetical protein
LLRAALLLGQSLSTSSRTAGGNSTFIFLCWDPRVGF